MYRQCACFLLLAGLSGCAQAGIGGFDEDAGSESGEADGWPAGSRVVGESCARDDDCGSRLCRATAPGGGKRCVTRCRSQRDCGFPPGLFCAPVSASASEGYCIPASRAHCASCAVDGDCGALAERCLRGPGDSQPACHVDCALAGDAACPPDYACTTLSDGLASRRLCVPRPVAGVPVDCLDALGGFCRRGARPLPCVRQNQAGTCTGQRDCLEEAGRYGACDARAPELRSSCSTPPRPGCVEAAAAGVASTREHCGACGRACGAGEDCCNLACTPLGTVSACAACGDPCPGQSPTSDAHCQERQCAMSCRGENYDVDHDPANGCESADAPTGNHTQGSALYLGQFGCGDGDSRQSVSGRFPSDARPHGAPAVDGLDPSSGGAPDWFRIYARGGTFCANDIDLTLQVTSQQGHPSCYRLVVLTSTVGRRYDCTTGAQGSCRISAGASSYESNADLFLRVEKICPAAARDLATYSITGHL